jgi:hypothetical protein
LLLLMAGCGPAIAPVSGKVTLDGKPLGNATVTFMPDSDAKNPGPGSQAKTDAEGKYTLQLLTGERGAILGKHVVSITAYEGDDGSVPSSAPTSVFRKAILDEKYNSKSELRFEVLPGGSTSADFKLENVK